MQRGLAADALSAAGLPEEAFDTASTRFGSPAVIVGVLLKSNGDFEVLFAEEACGATQVYPNGELERFLPQPFEGQRQFSKVLSVLPERPVTFLLYFEGNSDRLARDSLARLQQMLG